MALLPKLDIIQDHAENEKRRLEVIYARYQNVESVFSITHIAIEELLAAGYRATSSTLFYQVKKDCLQFDVQKNVASIVLERTEANSRVGSIPFIPGISQRMSDIQEQVNDVLYYAYLIDN